MSWGQTELSWEQSAVTSGDERTVAGSDISAASVVARLSVGPAQAQHVLDTLSDTFDPDQAVVSAYDTGERWSVDIHFLSPPNETAVRALVGLAAGTDAAN